MALRRRTPREVLAYEEGYQAALVRLLDVSQQGIASLGGVVAVLKSEIAVGETVLANKRKAI
jgi:hypothetical protein